jgi:RNA polymerase sigma-70 factor, ECF subfamily
MTNPDDHDLIARSQSGDKHAFSRLVMRHWPHVQRVLLAAGVAPDEVEDVLQEAFLQAYLNLDNLRQPAKFRAWVCGIALNVARMGWRQRPFTLVSWEQVTESPLVDDQFLPDQAIDRYLLLDRLNEALADLPSSERKALLLIYRDGLPRNGRFVRHVTRSCQGAGTSGSSSLTNPIAGRTGGCNHAPAGQGGRDDPRTSC